ncbi:MAG TPA: hypothetical protein VJ124_21055 [Pyrinomonadaceae bacterium]|nr:hypothetical protein [Pyrinomonadaceae bacterium]
MRFILYRYAILYLGFGVCVVASGILDKDARWKILIDAALFLFSLTGMILYMFNLSVSYMIAVWNVVSLALIVGQLGVNLYDRQVAFSSAPRIRSVARQRWPMTLKVT